MKIDYQKLMWTLKQHLWGPVGSIVLHVVFLIMLTTFFVGQQTGKAPEVEVTMMETKAEVLEKVEEVVKKELEKVEIPPERDVVADVPVDATISTMDVPSDAPGSGGGGIGNTDGSGIGSGDSSLAAGFEIAVAKSPLVMKGLYASRTAGGRKGALSAYGGSGKGEEAVLRALRWLKDNQGEDGSWSKADATDPTAMAGLALLCFLAHGETPSSPEFGATVEKAMKYIVSKQQSSGAFGRDYTHGICTYAVTEGFGLTKIMALKDAMDRGIDFIIKGQQPTGGFDYGYRKGERWDMSVAGWQLQALKAAKMAGCSHSDLEKAADLGISFLRKEAFSANAGGFGYSGVPGTPGTASSPSMTGAGVLCLQLLGKGDSPEVRSGLEYLKAKVALPEWQEPSPGVEAKRGANPLYGWYYITQAKFQKGGKDWDEWNRAFSRLLTKSQEKDGHWEGGDHGGKVYSTALCCLMLEVYYRYLPTYKHVEVAAEAGAAKPAAGGGAPEDVVVGVK